MSAKYADAVWRNYTTVTGQPNEFFIACALARMADSAGNVEFTRARLASAARMLSGCSAHRRVEPSMSVMRKVTVPTGRGTILTGILMSGLSAAAAGAYALIPESCNGRITKKLPGSAPSTVPRSSNDRYPASTVVIASRKGSFG